MSKVLTLHTTGEGNEEHWFTRGTGYGNNEINSISDPQGGNTNEPPTSIPSPFARFDLLRTAFAKLIKSETLKGEKNDEKLVSQCFDVGQIFFNYEKVKDQFDIIKWDKQQGLHSLQNSSSIGHKRLGKALELFLKQDGGKANSGGYNFDKMDSIFILKYHGEISSGIVGGTSSSTLFFSSPNDLSFVKNIKFDTHTLFENGKYCPLYEREQAYQKFWYCISQQYDFNVYFPELYVYINKSKILFQKNNPNGWKEIKNIVETLNPESYSNEFTDLFTKNGDLVSIIDGFKMKKLTVNPVSLQSSDFVIQSPKFKRLYPDSLVPMILQDNYQGRLKYIQSNWDRNEVVPSFVEESWRENKRRLPGQQDFYPWLTVSDFLEPYIVRLVYPLNKDFYNNGGFDESDYDKSYLLPLKKDFFDFYNVEDISTLSKSMNILDWRGKGVAIQMKHLANTGIQVSLAICLKSDQPPIIFERVYKHNIVTSEPKQSDKYGGVIIESEFSLSIMPFIKMPQPIYRIHLVDRDVDILTFSNDYKLTFVDSDNTVLNIAEPKLRSKKKKDSGATSKVFVVENSFDHIIVEVDRKKGVIIPKFIEVETTHQEVGYKFSVDFGTTNTHIEYLSGQNRLPKALDITERDKQIIPLFDPSKIVNALVRNNIRSDAFTQLMEIEMIPNFIGEREAVKFPQRTILLENQPKQDNLIGMADFNIGFMYEKRPLIGYQLHTNLKWGNDSSNEKRVLGYLESILFILRNKVLLGGGKLEDTKLVWFYPTSMSRTRRIRLESNWNKLYQKYIGGNGISKLPESIAPHFWYEKSSAEYPSVSIDIGGGTTDIVIFYQKQLHTATSFKFAANAVFGDGYAKLGKASENGFVSKYESIIKSKLEESDNGDCRKVLSIFEEIERQQKSEDIVAFLFSLKENELLKGKVAIDFSDILSLDTSKKIVFLTFYVAIVYHLAKTMKMRGLLMPRYITFSGTGSKILDILAPDDITTLENIVKQVFEVIYASSYHEEGVELIKNENPKEVTCKGGLNSTNNSQWDEAVLNASKFKVLGTSNDCLFADSVSNLDGVRLVKYSDIQSLKASIAEEYKAFVELLFSLNKTFKDLDMNTGKLEEYKRILISNLNQNIQDGIDSKLEEVLATASLDDPIEETLFFYPLIGALPKLAFTLSKQS